MEGHHIVCCPCIEYPSLLQGATNERGAANTSLSQSLTIHFKATIQLFSKTMIFKLTVIHFLHNCICIIDNVFEGRLNIYWRLSNKLL